MVPRKGATKGGPVGTGLRSGKILLTLFCGVGFCLLSSHVAGRILCQLSHQAAYLGATQNRQRSRSLRLIDSAPYKVQWQWW